MVDLLRAFFAGYARIIVHVSIQRDALIDAMDRGSTAYLARPGASLTSVTRVEWQKPARWAIRYFLANPEPS